MCGFNAALIDCLMTSSALSHVISRTMRMRRAAKTRRMHGVSVLYRGQMYKISVQRSLLGDLVSPSLLCRLRRLRGHVVGGRQQVTHRTVTVFEHVKFLKMNFSN